MSFSATCWYSAGHSLDNTDCSESVTTQSLGTYITTNLNLENICFIAQTSQLFGPSSPIIAIFGNWRDNDVIMQR